MTRFDKFKTTDPKDVAQQICDLIYHKMDCEDCPVTDRCSRGRNGVFDYLMEEVEQE